MILEPKVDEERQLSNEARPELKNFLLSFKLPRDPVLNNGAALLLIERQHQFYSSACLNAHARMLCATA